jgi:hypothetical protein
MWVAAVKTVVKRLIPLILFSSRKCELQQVLGRVVVMIDISRQKLHSRDCFVINLPFRQLFLRSWFTYTRNHPLTYLVQGRAMRLTDQVRTSIEELIARDGRS